MPHNHEESIDTVIQDIHRWRREISDNFGSDMNAIVEDAMRRQEESGHRIIRAGELKSDYNRPHTQQKPAPETPPIVGTDARESA